MDRTIACVPTAIFRGDKRKMTHKSYCGFRAAVRVSRLSILPVLLLTLQSTGVAEFARKVQMQGPRIIYFVYVRSSLRTVAKTREHLFRVYARTVYRTRSTDRFFKGAFEKSVAPWVLELFSKSLCACER